MAKNLHNNAEIMQAALETHAPCWKCGAPHRPPSPAEWRKIVADVQDGRPPYFHWEEADLDYLEEQLKQGDFVVAIYAGQIVARHPDGSEFKINRR